MVPEIQHSIPQSGLEAARLPRVPDCGSYYQIDNLPLLPVSGGTFPEQSAVKDLYLASLVSGPAHHSEGEDSLPAVFAFVSNLHEQGFQRTNETDMERRLKNVFVYASELFSKVPDVEALVLYGSFLRGKPIDDVSDVDLRIVSPFEQNIGWEPLDPWRPTQSIERVQARFDEAGFENRSIMGRPVHVLFSSDFSNSNGTGLNYMLGGPLMAVMPVRNELGELTGLSLFFNDSGQDYRRDRAP